MSGTMLLATTINSPTEQVIIASIVKSGCAFPFTMSEIVSIRFGSFHIKIKLSCLKSKTNETLRLIDL